MFNITEIRPKFVLGFAISVQFMFYEFPSWWSYHDGFAGIRHSLMLVILEQKLLTHKQLEMYGCVLSTIATDALVLTHQAISIHSAD